MPTTLRTGTGTPGSEPENPAPPTEARTIPPPPLAATLPMIVASNSVIGPESLTPPP